MVNGESAKRRRGNRSPQYPAFDLKEALAKVGELYAKEGMHPTPYTVAIGDMGLSAGGSTGARALAALGHFGLVEQEGAGDERVVRVSRLARDILIDKRPVSEERDALIKKAALTPMVFAAIFKKYGINLPSSETVKLWLIKELNFNPNVVGDVVRDYHATVKYARLDGADVEDDILNGESDEDLGDSPPPGTPPDRRDQKEKEPQMPDAGTPTEPWDLAIPLRGGTAVLRVPRPLTVENLTLLQEAVRTMLDFQKKVLGFEPGQEEPR